MQFLCEFNSKYWKEEVNVGVYVNRDLVDTLCMTSSKDSNGAL